MKQSLQLRLGQQLTMTPQLQQAIKLLQLASLELQNEIQQILDSNPMLEREEESEPPVNNDSSNPGTSSDNQTVESEKRVENAYQDTDDASPETTDAGWENDWTTSYQGNSGNNESAPDREIYERQDFKETSLRDHLQWQLHLSQMSDSDRAIAMAIVDAIDEDGYLHEDLQAIFDAVSSGYEIEMDEVEAVLHRVQHFDPIGVAARNPAECLLLQLQTYPTDTPGYDTARDIISNHLPLLATHDYARLKRVTGADEQTIKNAELLICSLNPKPGASIASARTEYIVPDVFVQKRNDKWHIELNPDLAPKLRINSYYAGMIRRSEKSDDNNYLRNNLQEARWFLKSLQSRNDTILKVAKTIVQRQRAFLEYGEEAMKPLVLRDVAETLEMHESTISRVTNQKYMHTPRGIFEFKHFFSSHVSTADGGECSATAIRAMIRKLITAEDNNKPLSDSKLAQMLEQQGINVARRTIAKYRESMSIPPSNERKRLT
ncbi:MAG: RNA polymerase factor sigma-54 [Gammaproteobacteria bacterium]|nr:RNA polymerase factor sigma-54 [Gammaproteobacteria bacterium]